MILRILPDICYSLINRNTIPKLIYSIIIFSILQFKIAYLCGGLNSCEQLLRVFLQPLFPFSEIKTSLFRFFTHREVLQTIRRKKKKVSKLIHNARNSPKCLRVN